MNYIKYKIFNIKKYVKKYLKQKEIDNLKLIITLLVKDEEDILETNIRFHKAMGADGFIVTSHNSTDRTNEILEKLKQEGIILEIIYETDPAYNKVMFVDRMIKIAKRKYKADWIINADADEFYYSKDLNLKKSIIKYKKTNVNVLKVDSTFYYPDNREDFLRSPYFVTRPFLKYVAEKLDITNKPEFKGFIGSNGCTKVIHKTKGYKRIVIGNHDIKMRYKVCVEPADIVLYHYTIRNYNESIKKVKRYKESLKLIGKGFGVHMRKIIQEYESGELKKNYDKLYNENMKKFLIEQGVVTIDRSIPNFLEQIHL